MRKVSTLILVSLLSLLSFSCLSLASFFPTAEAPESPVSSMLVLEAGELDGSIRAYKYNATLAPG